jgi:hypothetical protein
MHQPPQNSRALEPFFVSRAFVFATDIDTDVVT